MSVEALALALHHSKASGTGKLVLLGIANHEGDGGAWPTIATLARYANCSERTVQRVIGELVESGELAVRYNAGPGARQDQRPNVYRVTVRCPAGCDGSTQHRVNGVTPTSSRDERGDTGVANGVTSVAQRGDTGVTLTINEPSEEPSLFAVASDGQPETEAARANRLAKVYCDRQPMSRFPAIAGIVRRACRAGHPDDAITDALNRLADEGRSVTVETLRIELEGMPPSRDARPSATAMYVDAANRLNDSATAVSALRELGA